MSGTGYINGAYETTVGSEANSSPTLSSKVIYIPSTSAQLSLNPSPLLRDDENRGVDEPITALEDTHAPTWSLESRAYPDVLGFLLKAQLGAPSTTAGNGVITDANGVVVPTGAYRHVWTSPFGPSGNSPQTTQWRLGYNDQSVYYKLQGAAVESMGFSVPEAGGVGLAASGPGCYLTRISDPSLTPSYETLTIPPFLRAHLAVNTNMSNTATNEGDFSFNITSPVEAVSDLSSASRFPTQMYKGDDAVGLTGTIGKSAIDADDWDALKAATSFTLKYTFTSTATIASSYPYKLIVNVGSAQYVGGEAEPLTSSRRLKASWQWRAGYTGTAGNVSLSLINASSSYS